MTVENSQKIRVSTLDEVAAFMEELEKKALQNPKGTFEELEQIQRGKFNDSVELKDDYDQNLACAIALNTQARCLNILDNNQSALEKIAEAKKVLDNLSQHDKRVKFCLGKKFETKALVKWTMREIEEAHLAIDSAIKIYDEINDRKSYHNALNSKACILLTTNNYTQAIELLLKAADYFEKSSENQRLATILHNIGGVYYSSGQYDLANKTILKALTTLGEENSPKALEMLNALGLVNHELKQNSKAEAYFQKALSLSRKFDNIDNQVSALVGLGNINLEKQNPDEALNYYLQAYELRKLGSGRQSELSILEGISKVYFLKKDWQNSKTWYEKLLGLAQNFNNNRYLAKAYLGLYQCAEIEEDFKTALEYHKQYLHYFTENQKEEQNEKLVSLKQTFSYEQAKKESENLEKLNQQLFKAHNTLSEIVAELEIQKADLELQYSRIKGLLSLLSEGILIEDENLVTHFINQKLLDLFDIPGTPQDFISKSANRLRVLVQRKVQNSSEERKFFEQCFFEKRQVIGREVKQTSGKIYKFSFLPLFNNERYRGCLWLFEDITVIKNQEKEREMTIEKLNEANTKLQKANKLKSDIISIAIHDLKNPLNIIIGFSELIKTGTHDLETVKSYIESIERSSKRMLSLVQELLNSSASDRDEPLLNLKLTDVNEIVRYVVANQEILAQEKNIRLEIEEKASCKVYAESNKLYEVFENLVSNAIKYSPREKKVIVSIEKLEPAKSQLRRKSDLERTALGVARISVKDEGQGLTEDDKQRLFQPFQKLSSRPTGKEHSSGLGLYIVKNLVEKHYGKVWAESEGKGKGATFFVELPLAE
jgi:signal transduction histidine kinase/TolA-binding protein